MKNISILLIAVGLCTSMPAATPADGILIDKVWSGHTVGFAMVVQQDHQFIAYYDAERKLTVAGRKIGDDHWVYAHPAGVAVPGRDRLSNVTGWDSHNRIAMALDRDGCLHLSCNMHADPLVYYRTREPFDLTTLERIDRMTGEAETRVTYPDFFKNAAGDLLFRYRTGGSGNGSDLYNSYDPATRKWRRLFTGPLLDGEGARSAYGTGPQRGPDGRYHMVWMWRDTPDAMTNHTLSYAQSADLVHWENSTGQPIARPITIANAEVIDAAAPGGGLINMTFGLGFDARQLPVVVYHRYDDAGHSQIYVARPDGHGAWTNRQLSDWHFRWEFPGAGSQPKQVSVGRPVLEPDGSLLVDFASNESGPGRWRVDGKTLAVTATLPAAPNDEPEYSIPPDKKFPDLASRSLSVSSEGSRWVLRWATLGVNRELKDRPVPPPSELRLYQMVTPGTKALPDS